jgi:hypothetical protein
MWTGLNVVSDEYSQVADVSIPVPLPKLEVIRQIRNSRPALEFVKPKV